MGGNLSSFGPGPILSGADVSPAIKCSGLGTWRFLPIISISDSLKLPTVGAARFRVPQARACLLLPLRGIAMGANTGLQGAACDDRDEEEDLSLILLCPEPPGPRCLPVREEDRMVLFVFRGQYRE